jgi:hypothetical protein
MIPASIREVVERAKLASIAHSDVCIVTPEDLAVAAEGMRRQQELIERDAPRLSKEEQLGKAFAVVVEDKVSEAKEEITSHF